MMMSKILTCCFLFVLVTSNAQYIGIEQADKEKITAWAVTNIDEYDGTYSFGYSESESKLVLLVSKNQICAQIAFASYSKKKKKWITAYKNLSNVSIKNGIFKSDQHTGRFVIYDEKRALLINNPWQPIEPDKYEIGLLAGENKFFILGNYPQASLKYLSPKDLERFSSDELEIMRNEIFARYGLIFKAGSKIDKYFRMQKWYSPDHTDVSNFLTNIEKHNVRLLLRKE